MSQNANPAGWHRDPGGQFEFRYWDGRAWTDTVAQNGQTFTQPLPTAPPTDSTLWNANVLLMNQKGKLLDVSNEHTICSESGAVLGHLREPKVSGAGLAGRALLGTNRGVFHLTDPAGGHLLRSRRGPQFLIIDGPGGEIGRIKQMNMTTLQRLRFEFQQDDRTLGKMEAKTWSDDWNMNIYGADGELVADVAKTRGGVAAALFTSADHYRITIHGQIDPMLRTLVTFSALMLDLTRFN